MTNIQSRIKNAISNGHNGYISHSTNEPYTDGSQQQYFSNITKAFYENTLQYASNFVVAQVQGVDYNDFYAYTPLRIRVADVIDPTTGNNLGADWQRIIIENGNIDFIPRGAKVVFGGKTWLVTNPDNVESVMGTSVIRRCNAIWHYLDDYGNVQSEPFCYGNGAGDMATTNDVKETMILVNGYQHSVMQLNPSTSVLTHNYRIVLGNSAFAIHTIQNFVQEFTEDEGSTHIQFFDLYRTEPLDIDDMVNKVAGGNAFSWTVSIDNVESVAPGSETQLNAVSTKGETPVTGLPINYLWQSSDEQVATVDENGVLKAISEGTTTITCTLQQNGKFFDTMTVTVSAEKIGKLEWAYDIPSSVVQYQEANVTAICPEGTVEYSFGGADPSCYQAQDIDGNMLVTCYQASDIPLIVTAVCGDQTIQKSIVLEGW